MAQDSVDLAPTAAMLAVYAVAGRELAKVQMAWGRVKGGGLSALSAALRQHGLPAVP